MKTTTTKFDANNDTIQKFHDEIMQMYDEVILCRIVKNFTAGKMLFNFFKQSSEYDDLCILLFKNVLLKQQCSSVSKHIIFGKHVQIIRDFSAPFSCISHKQIGPETDISEFRESTISVLFLIALQMFEMAALYLQQHKEEKNDNVLSK